jgi:ribosomal subunit interface protein
MVVTYSSKHTEMNGEMKDYLEKRLQKFKFYYEQIINIYATVDILRGKYITELKILANRDTYFAKEIAPTWQESFDKVTDKVEKEIKNKKDKIKRHHK